MKSMVLVLIGLCAVGCGTAADQPDPFEGEWSGVRVVTTWNRPRSGDGGRGSFAVRASGDGYAVTLETYGVRCAMAAARVRPDPSVPDERVNTLPGAAPCSLRVGPEGASVMVAVERCSAAASTPGPGEAAGVRLACYGTMTRDDGSTEANAGFSFEP